MGLNFWIELLKLLLILPFIVILIYISLKYGGKHLGKMNNGGIIKVHERVPLTQNSFLAVVTIGDKPYVITNGDKGAQILVELDLETFNKYKKQVNSKDNAILKDYIKRINFLKREDENEKIS